MKFWMPTKHPQLLIMEHHPVTPNLQLITETLLSETLFPCRLQQRQQRSMMAFWIRPNLQHVIGIFLSTMAFRNMYVVLIPLPFYDILQIRILLFFITIYGRDHHREIHNRQTYNLCVAFLHHTFSTLASDTSYAGAAVQGGSR
mmetsp:Transcript_19014/g.36056  ORF Transcript_19014/g.36056 Transcript_19014/m.36056 type:complete len:144 (-) Transcript_19014:240-671(-)